MEISAVMRSLLDAAVPPLCSLILSEGEPKAYLLAFQNQALQLSVGDRPFHTKPMFLEIKEKRKIGDRLPVTITIAVD